MYKNIVVIASIAVLCRLCFLYGKSQAKTEIIEKQVVVIKYETKEICRIAARPNLNDDAISELFAKGEL